MLMYTIMFSVVIITILIGYLRVRRQIDINVLLLSIWSFSSFVSIYLYINDGDGYYIGVKDRVEFFPYVYLLLLICVSIYPIMRINSANILNVNALRYKDMIYVFSIVLIAMSALPFVENILHMGKLIVGNNLKGELSGAYDYKRIENIAIWFSFLGKKLNTVVMLFNKVSPLLFFYWLSREGCRYITAIFMLLPISNSLMYGFMTSSRAILFVDCIYFVYCFFLLRNTLDVSVRSIIQKYSFIFGSAVLLFIIVISVARFDESISRRYSVSIFTWVAIYAGESSLRFNVYMWNIKNLMLGDYCFAGIKNIFGSDVPTDLLLREAILYFKTGVLPNVFYTFIGDLFGDFGLIGAFVFVFCASMPIIIIFKKQEDEVFFDSILYLSVWYSVCSAGFTYFPYKVAFLNYSLLCSLFLCLVLYIVRKIR